MYIPLQYLVSGGNAYAIDDENISLVLLLNLMALLIGTTHTTSILVMKT